MNYRQGDVFLRKTNRKTMRGLKKANSILAFGEATGHHHVILDGEVYADEDGNLYVRATTKTRLRHQDQAGAVAEHAEHALQEGIYQVTIEKEYEPEGWREVYD